MSTEGLYIYCVVPVFYDNSLFSSLNRSGLICINYRDISAIASVCNDTAIDFSDRESLGNLIIHHQKTLEDLISSGFRHLIPVKVGTAISKRREVIEILAAGYELINETFRKNQSMAEVDLAVTWSDFSSVLKSLAKGQLTGSEYTEQHQEAGRISHDEQMKKWIMLRTKLKEKSAAAELRILDSLSRFCIDIKHHEVMNYQMITNSAFLINLSDLENFEQQVARLNREYDGALNFQLIGPLPCYSFFTLETENISPERIYKANIELGLKESPSEAAIKEAYNRKTKMLNTGVRLQEGEEEYFNSITKAYHTLMAYSARISQDPPEKEGEERGFDAVDNMIMVRIKC